MNDKFKSILFEYLKDNLSIQIETKNNYTGGMGSSGNLYENYHKIQLVLEGEIISEEYLD